MSEVIQAEQLKQYIARIEKLEQDKTEITDDLKQVFDEVKASGYDVKIIKHVLKLSKMEKDKLAEQDALIDMYRAALKI